MPYDIGQSLLANIMRARSCLPKRAHSDAALAFPMLRKNLYIFVKIVFIVMILLRFGCYTPA